MTPSHYMPIRWTLQAEGLGIALLCLMLYAHHPAGWGLFALLILAPDLFMLGYVAGKQVGAVCYNIGHSYLTPLLLAAAGTMSDSQNAYAMALIWGAHIGLDRAIGYGLKYAAGFKATHFTRL